MLKLFSGIPIPLVGLVTLFVLLPNLLVVFFPSIGIPIFYPLRVQGNLETASLAGMILALIFHYINGSGRRRPSRQLDEE